MIEHKSNCAILPLEEWDRKVWCDCGCWDARKAEALSRDHFMVEAIPLMEEALWAPPRREVEE